MYMCCSVSFAMFQLENLKVPVTEQLVDLKPLFRTRPFGLQYIAKRHKIHQVSEP